VMGLETWPSILKASNVTLRFRTMLKLGITRVGIWRTPLPEEWWPIIEQFVDGTV
jgi:hypothetical protein